jgi:hypothetical protein
LIPRRKNSQSPWESRKLIAAGKIQRWDVVKWSVTVNIALAVVAAAAPAPAVFFRLCLLVLSAGVLVASWRLVVHYNRRMEGAQDQAVTIVSKWLKPRGVDYDAIAGGSVEKEYSVPREKYDLTEFRIFFAILAVSPVLVFFSLFLHHPSP